MKIIRLTGGIAFILGFVAVVFAGIPWYIYHDPALPWWLKIAVYLIIGGIIIVLLAVAFEHRIVKTPFVGFHPKKSRARLLIHNFAEVPGCEISEALGLVKGHTIFAVSLGRDLSALMRLIPGGELVEYTEMMGQARELAVQRMTLEAEKMEADAIINVRFVTTSVVTGAAELLVYGTAVKLRNPAA